MLTFLYIIFSYLLGAVPFGFLAGRLNGIDLREHGSCNIGATNAMRVLGKGWGILVFVLDFAKGFIPVYLWKHVVSSYSFNGVDGSLWWSSGILVLVGLATILGHTYTCFLHFKGGKGVATTGGVLFAISPLVAVISVAYWVLALFVTRYVSLASVTAGIVMILAALYDLDYFGETGWAWRPQILIIFFLTLVAVLVIVKHRSNLRRLMLGTEPKVFSKKSSN